MDEAVLRLLMDSRLSSDARVLGAFVASKGPGEHPIAIADFMDVLGPDASRGRVQRALAQLERRAWTTRTPGGRGHHDRFSFSYVETEQLNKDSYRENEQLNDSYAETQQLNTDSCREIEQLNENGGDYRGGSNQSPTILAIPTTTTTTTASGGEREAAIAEMQVVANDAAHQVEPGPKRTAFNATIRGLVNGDDYTAWRDQEGNKVRWSERPRLLRLALDHFLAGKARDVRTALCYTVIPQQYDPFPQRRSDDLPAPSEPTTTDHAVTARDILGAFEIAGSWLSTSGSRAMGFRLIEKEDPRLWARAGPYLRHMDLANLWTVYENRHERPRVFDDAVNSAIAAAHRELQRAG